MYIKLADPEPSKTATNYRILYVYMDSTSS